MTCRHEDSLPVDVRNPLDGTTETVARICTRCLEQLPANHGCPDCEWSEIETRALCDPAPEVTTTCTRACNEHQSTAPRTRVVLLTDPPADPAAPTRAELDAGTDIGGFLQ